MPDPEWARIVVYPVEREADVLRAVEQARGADLVVKASGVGIFDQLLEAAVLDLQSGLTRVVFWDVDAPATLDRVQDNPGDGFLPLIQSYDLVFTYGGGDPVVKAYKSLGARHCVPIYNALDPHTHFPAAPDPHFEADLAFLGNRLPDREARVEEFFLRPAGRLPERSLLLGGNGWEDKPMPANVRYLRHVYTRDHNAFNATPTAVLNVTRESMARYGFSPATRVFEAAGAGACLITDAWEGIEMFFEPEREILVVHSGEDLVECLKRLDRSEARKLGAAALRRVCSEHTYARRAAQVEAVLDGGRRRRRVNGERTFRLRLVILGLSITSSWGNGHATTYRGLVRELRARGHSVLFLERDVPWYAQNRDLSEADSGGVQLYASVADLRARFGLAIREADAVIVGSYVPDGIEIGEWVTGQAGGVTAFYDIDTPVTLAGLRRGQTDYLSEDLIRRYRLYLSFTGGPTLERIEREFGSPMARPLYCSVDPRLYYPEDMDQRWHLGYLGTYSADRQPGLQSLLLDAAARRRDGSFVVAGPQYPKDITWPDNVERIEHVPPAGHRAFFNQQRFTLNLTRADMIAAGYSPSVRLFEAAACGTAIISDFWHGLDEVLEPGEEVLIARTAQETLNYLENIGPEEARAIGARARRRVLLRHTAAHRASELEGYLGELLRVRRIEKGAGCLPVDVLGVC